MMKISRHVLTISCYHCADHTKDSIQRFQSREPTVERPDWEIGILRRNDRTRRRSKQWLLLLPTFCQGVSEEYKKSTTTTTTSYAATPFGNDRDLEKTVHQYGCLTGGYINYLYGPQASSTR